MTIQKVEDSFRFGSRRTIVYNLLKLLDLEYDKVASEWGINVLIVEIQHILCV